MLQILFVYYALPIITDGAIQMDDATAAVLTFVLNYAAYLCEIFRGGIQSISRGQYEGAKVLGFTYAQTMRKIILPQATKLMLPNFVNQFVIALKDTTIVSAIGLVELFQTGKIIIARNYQSFKMYAILAVFYLVIITLLTRFAKKIRKEG